jgi:hypothetical protein
MDILNKITQITTLSWAENCGACVYWTRHSDARMPDHGECAQRHVGRYTHRSTACEFKPSLFGAKKQ